METSPHLFKTLVGSRLYGLGHEHSDFDYRGVKTTPLGPLLLAKGTKNEQVKYEDQDTTWYEGSHFVRLLMGGNPTMLEMVYSLELHNPELLEQLGLLKLLDSQNVLSSTKGYIKGALAKPTNKGLACGVLYVGLYQHFFAGKDMKFRVGLARSLREGRHVEVAAKGLTAFLEAQEDVFERRADQSHAHHLIKAWYA